MKRITTLAMAALMLTAVFAPPVLAKDFKVGIIISERLLNEYPEAQDAQKTLNEEINEWQRQAQSMQDELQSLQKELSEEAMMFYTAEKKAQKQAEFQRKLGAFRDFQQSIEQKAMQRNQELFAPINEKIQKVLDSIAEKDGYDIILDAVGASIAYANPELDITDRVLEELKNQK
ncbi:MAG: OmpH family outer membrane protein [bacterium]